MNNINHRARATEEAIERAVAADGGNSYRAGLERHIMAQTDAFAQTHSPFRAHLGASLIGGKCERALWYGFRWVTVPSFSGRVMRLFNTGHLSEAKFLACLEAIGCTVYQINDQGTQYRMTGHGGHYGGSLDGVVTGLPDWPNGPALAEFKTHSDKSFQTLVKSGVAVAKPEHVSQMNQYMAAFDLPVAIYMALNKNDEALYCEMVYFDKELAGNDYTRAGGIIASDSPPPRISNSPGWLVCKWCDHKEVCHGDDQPAQNCRTCAHVTAREDGVWVCENAVNAEVDDTACVLDKDAQEAACSHYEVNWTIKE